MEPSTDQNISSTPSQKSAPIDVEKRESQTSKAKTEEPKSEELGKSSKLFEDRNIELREDVYGIYVDDRGCRYKIKRFTWKNHNKIEVQVISYGARIVSVKMPDKNAEMTDIVLGCEDLAGYVYYGGHYLGATIGRVSNVISHGTFMLDGKQVWLPQNKGNHHYNGGIRSIDKDAWMTHVEGTKVMMSTVSSHLDNGYPGDLLIRVTFELSSMNEFSIDMEAQTTAPTLVNLSNLTYFNLAGHHTGPDEIYRHYVTMNCNCFTPTIKGMPTGEILNVVHTPFDFQVPVLLGKVMGIVPKDGFNQNLCVNRGVHQDSCFVARALHIPSGRMLEMYSNQCGVNFSTANDFGYGERLAMSDLLPKTVQDKLPESNELEEKLLLFRKIHEEMFEVLQIDRQNNLQDLLNLIIKLQMHKCKSDSSINSIISLSDLIVTPLQKKYLDSMLEFACKEDSKDCMKLQEIVRELLSIVIVEDKDSDSSIASVVEKTESQIEQEKRLKYEKTQKQAELLENVRQNVRKRVNFIPPYYKDSKSIVGKNGVRYKMHGGIAFQSQNYPNAINFKNFPSCVVKPGETYKHNITYKFWIRAGNPMKWIKRNLNENKAKLF